MYDNGADFAWICEMLIWTMQCQFIKSIFAMHLDTQKGMCTQKGTVNNEFTL